MFEHSYQGEVIIDVHKKFFFSFVPESGINQAFCMANIIRVVGFLACGGVRKANSPVPHPHPACPIFV